MSSTHEKFLGRRFNHNTMMWEFIDGSRVPLPEEFRQQFMTDIQQPTGGSIIALLKKWDFEDRHKIHLSAAKADDVNP